MKSRIPRHLSKEARGIWRTIENEWELDGHSKIILLVALEAFDEFRAAQAELKKDGMTFKTPTNQLKKHPALEVLKVARGQFLHSWKMLNLGIEPPKEI